MKTHYLQLGGWYIRMANYGSPRHMEENKMRYMDCVEVIVEKDSYAKEGVHKGMQGVVWEKEPKDGCWVILFPQCGDKEDIADLYMKEEDLKLIPVMHADRNEQIKAQFEALEKGKTAEDVSDYMI